MYAQADTITPARSSIHDFFAGGGWPFQRRHPQTFVTVRAVAIVGFVTFGSILLSRGYEIGVVLYLAAAKDLALGYRLLKTSLARRH